MYFFLVSFMQLRQWAYLQAVVDTSLTYGNSRCRQAYDRSGKPVQEGYDESPKAGGGGETHIQPPPATLPEKRNRPILQIAASSCWARWAGASLQASTSDGATGSLASATCHCHSSFSRRGGWKRGEMELDGDMMRQLINTSTTPLFDCDEPA